MKNRYQSEVDEFHKNFSRFRDKKIVLYGVGRYTATLLNSVTQYNFIGLMDKDPANVGEIMFGLPVLSLEEVEQKADLVVINTSGTYWNVIFQRIKNIKIPVYFLNGDLAAEDKIEQTNNEYWNSSLTALRKKIEEADIVSFDFFDTLFSRKTCSPRDIFELLEREIRAEMKIDIPYRELRSKAAQVLDYDYTLEELYWEIGRETKLEEGVLQEIYFREICLEKAFLIARMCMLDCLKYAEDLNKEIYIISDMYLPKSFYQDKMKQYNIDIAEKKILISSEKKESKRQGTLWKQYLKEFTGKKKLLHIGDDIDADVKNPQKYGITTYYVASQISLLRLSSIREIEPQIIDINASIMMGLIFNKFFQDPFAINTRRGVVSIQDASIMGYAVFGPVMYVFYSWLIEQIKLDHVKKLIFMSRDGFFLQEDYEYYCKWICESVDSSYIGISRQLAITASIRTERELFDFINMPYSGSSVQLLEDRFNIKAKAEEQHFKLEELYEVYREDIWRYVRTVRKNYLCYLKEKKLNDDCAVVDLGYYGNNQRYLNLLTGLQMKGYYFNADVSAQNDNTKVNLMKACFQETKDYKGAMSKILENMIVIESFLTAPYGMVKSIDETGNWICDEGHGNQKMFAVKEAINDGVKQYIRDCHTNRVEKTDIKLVKFIDYWFGLCMSGKLDFSDEIKKSFYNDNAMMNRIESMIFY